MIVLHHHPVDPHRYRLVQPPFAHLLDLRFGDHAEGDECFRVCPFVVVDMHILECGLPFVRLHADALVDLFGVHQRVRAEGNEEVQLRHAR